MNMLNPAPTGNQLVRAMGIWLAESFGPKVPSLEGLGFWGLGGLGFKFWGFRGSRGFRGFRV